MKIMILTLDAAIVLEVKSTDAICMEHLSPQVAISTASRFFLFLLWF